MPIKIFFCYAHEDEPLLNKLKSHLKPLLRMGLIEVWHDRDISAGMKWEEEINKHLNEANIILLLVSPDFMDSDYCYGKEMQRALERDQRGEARVIPVILRPVYWRGVLGTLQALPTDGKPVMSSSWYSPDDAFFNVAEGIREVIEKISKRSSSDSPTPVSAEGIREVIEKISEQYSASPPSPVSAKDLEILKKSYEAVRLGRLREPATIRDIAAVFEAHANDPNIDIDAMKVAKILYQRALFIEQVNKYGNHISKAEIERLIEAYEAVRAGRLRDPKTIRSLAEKFEALANNHDVDFDPLRAAQNLYNRAWVYEQQNINGKESVQ